MPSLLEYFQNLPGLPEGGVVPEWMLPGYQRRIDEGFAPFAAQKGDRLPLATPPSAPPPAWTENAAYPLTQFQSVPQERMPVALGNSAPPVAPAVGPATPAPA